MELAGAGADEVAEEFIAHRFGEFEAAPDTEFFRAIVTGVPAHQMEIDKAIAATLDKNIRTGDIKSEGSKVVNTQEMGDAILAELEAM